MQECDRATNAMVGPRTVIVNGGVDLSKNPIWIEAPHIFKVSGKYYLICAEGGTADQHSEVVFRSESVVRARTCRSTATRFSRSGSSTDRARSRSRRRVTPISSRRRTANGGRCSSARARTRDDTYNTGRETFMLPGAVARRLADHSRGQRDGAVGREATEPACARPRRNPPMSGNFVDRDDFNGKTLRYQWNMIRTPHEHWYDLTSTPGWLTIKARAEKLGELGQPSFLGRRQQHLTASASVAMRYAPEKPGDEAGITAFQNDDHFYLLAVANDERGACGSTRALGDRRSEGRDRGGGVARHSLPRATRRRISRFRRADRCTISTTAERPMPGRCSRRTSTGRS